MYHGSSSDFFSPKNPLPPYLACWHQAFAALDQTQSIPVELLFDRFPDAPFRETVRIPREADAHTKQISAMYLAVLINNAVCTVGAKSVNITTSETEIDKDIIQYIQQSTTYPNNSLTIKPSNFIYSLAERVYGSSFSIKADTINRTPTTPPLPAAATAPSRPRTQARPGSVLAINIGQHLTSFAVVKIATLKKYQLEHFTRLDTWPKDEQTTFAQIWDHVLTTVRQTLAATPHDIEAISLSIAATVVAGEIQPIARFGLFAWSRPEDLAGVNALVKDRCREYFPGLPVTIMNDAEAQSLFAFAFCDRPPEASGEHFLSLRLGAGPSIRCLDANGIPGPGIHEYGWLATTLNKNRMLNGIFATTSLYLSHFGPGYIAQELGLLHKYGVGIEQAIAFFHDRLLSENPTEALDAQKIYFILGAHIAMLAFEVHRHNPLGTVVLHGSRTNRIDDTAFDVIKNGFYAFSAKHHLPLDFVELCCLKDSSAQAGLVGAALAALRA
jgi:hypothetical protein